MRGVSLAFALLAACGGSQGAADPEPATQPELDDEEAPTDRRSRVPGDDEPDDSSMSVEGLKGHLAPYDIRKGVEPHAGALAACFDDCQKKQRYLDGDIEMAFTVATDGSVKSVQIAKSDLGSWPVERCLLEIGRGIQFAEPTGGEAEFSLPVDFTVRRAMLTLWWSEERAETEVADVIVELDACEPTPSNVWVTLYVGTRGAVKSAGFASPADEPIDDAWAECAAAVVTKWTLSDPRGKVAKAGFRYNAE